MFHNECIRKWYEVSDDCPVCRTEQTNDPLIVFKHNIHENISRNYMDVIQSLEQDVSRYRRRLARALRDM